MNMSFIITEENYGTIDAENSTGMVTILSYFINIFIPFKPT